MTNDRTFQKFTGEVEQLLGGTASGKGYAAGGPNGPNPLYEFVQGLSNSSAHGLGEIVYKAQRYSSKHNQEDVLKIAAWAFLVWRFHRDETKT